ncbi:hepcidin [Dasypus novemcinctus]|uniref:hepcidin n=1 Tax=Dasypus novemcinctus TaxID=9361 RepID=UPI000328B53B|nr:hepcidin [Dasypus novemcinctus]
MATSTRIQAACLLLLLLASLPGRSDSLQQTGPLTALQPRDAAGAKASPTALFQRLRKRDTHIPICLFCCKCCPGSQCGICCKT